MKCFDNIMLLIYWLEPIITSLHKIQNFRRAPDSNGWNGFPFSGFPRYFCFYISSNTKYPRLYLYPFQDNHRLVCSHSTNFFVLALDYCQSFNSNTFPEFDGLSNEYSYSLARIHLNKFGILLSLNKTAAFVHSASSPIWLQNPDLHREPPGYEPGQLLIASILRRLYFYYKFIY